MNELIEKLLKVLGSVQDPRWKRELQTMSEAGRFPVTSAMNELTDKLLNLYGSIQNPQWKRELQKRLKLVVSV